jgi:hypothetical protein
MAEQRSEMSRCVGLSVRGESIHQVRERLSSRCRCDYMLTSSRSLVSVVVCFFGIVLALFSPRLSAVSPFFGQEWQIAMRMQLNFSSSEGSYSCFTGFFVMAVSALVFSPMPSAIANLSISRQRENGNRAQNQKQFQAEVFE